MKHLKTYKLFEAQTTDTTRFAVITFEQADEEDGGRSEVIVDLHNTGKGKMFPVEWEIDPTVISNALFKSLKENFGDGPHTIAQINSPTSSVAVQAAADNDMEGNFPDAVSVTVRAVPLGNVLGGCVSPASIIRLLPGVGYIGWKSLAWMYVQMAYQKKSFEESLEKFKSIVEGRQSYALSGWHWNFPLEEAERDLIPLMALANREDDLEALDAYMLENPLDIDLLDGFPDIKAGVLQRTGLKDMSALARSMRKGMV